MVLLGLAWIVVLLPAALRARRTTPLPATERFKQSLELIAPGAGGRWVVVPQSPERLAQIALRKAQRRRRRLLGLLLWAALLSLLPAAFVGERAWAIHLGLDLTLCLYSLFLIETKRRRNERARKVHPIAPPLAARRYAAVPFNAPITEAHH
ncbi:MAG: hypothetical protein ABR575_01745 [Actinomycetota bacterium]